MFLKMHWVYSRPGTFMSIFPTFWKVLLSHLCMVSSAAFSSQLGYSQDALHSLTTLSEELLPPGSITSPKHMCLPDVWGLMCLFETPTSLRLQRRDLLSCGHGHIHGAQHIVSAQ